MSGSTAHRPTISNEEQLWLMQQVKLNVMTVDEAVSWTEARENEMRSLDHDATSPTPKPEKSPTTNVKHQFRAARMFKNMLNSKKVTKKHLLPETPPIGKRKLSSVEDTNDVFSTFANDLKNKQIYNFSVYKCAKHKAPQKRILQIDFDARQITIIHRGSIVKTSPFSSLVNIDGQEGKKLFIHFDDGQELEINAENLADKTKLIRLLNVVNEQNEYEERGQPFDPIGKLQLSFKIIKEGYLEKKGGYTASHWNQRLVVIRAGELAYYRVDEEEPSAALNIIHLSPGSIAINPEDSNTFTIATTKESHRFRLPEGTAILPCSQELIRDEWIQAIQDGCNKHYQQEEEAENADSQETKQDSGGNNAADEGERIESYNIVFEELEKLKKIVLSRGHNDHENISNQFKHFLSVLEDHQKAGKKVMAASNIRLTNDKKEQTDPSENQNDFETTKTQRIIKNVPDTGDSIYDIVDEGINGMENKNGYTEESTPFLTSSSTVNVSPQKFKFPNGDLNHYNRSLYSDVSNLEPVEEENPYDLAGDDNDADLKSSKQLVNGGNAVFQNKNTETGDAVLNDLPPPPSPRSMQQILEARTEVDGSSKRSALLPLPPTPVFHSNGTTLSGKSPTLLQEKPFSSNDIDIPPMLPPTVPSPPSVPAPPPPPPASNPPPPPSSMGGSVLKGVTPLRPFHWVPVPRQMIAQSMWVSVALPVEVIGKQELEEMFRVNSDKKKGVVTNDAQGKALSLPGDITPKKKHLESYLDQKTAQNLGIFLAGFKLRGEELSRKISMVNEADGGISTEHIVGLRKYAPEPELKSLYARHAGREAEELTKQDRFLAEISRIPRLSVRLETLQIVRELPQEIENLEPEIDLAVNACRELLTSKLLESMLAYVLAVANQINATNSKGTTQGIRLSSLQKTSVMKTNDKKSTLLQVVLTKAKESHPELLNLRNELASVSKSQSYSTKGLLAEIDIVRKSSFKAKKNCELLRRKKNQPTAEDLAFCGDIENALGSLDSVIVKMSEKCVEIKRTLAKILTKFGEPPATDSQELFGWIREFLEEFRKTCS